MLKSISYLISTENICRDYRLWWSFEFDRNFVHPLLNDLTPYINFRYFMIKTYNV